MTVNKDNVIRWFNRFERRHFKEGRQFPTFEEIDAFVSAGKTISYPCSNISGEWQLVALGTFSREDPKGKRYAKSSA
jgi:hypothetical protein